MVDLQSISIAIASVGVFVAAVYYMFQIRHQNRLRRTDVIMRLHSFYGSETFQKAVGSVLATDYKDYDDFVKRYGSPLPPSPASDLLISLRIVGNFFEGIGVLTSEKLLDIDLIKKLFAVEIYWKKAEPLVKELRKQLDNPSYYKWFEYLCNEVKKRE